MKPARYVLAVARVGALCAALAPSPAAAQQTAVDLSSIARNHFENGTLYYGSRRYREAAHEFREAYEISNRPELLFNYGRALEDAGDLAEALDAYQRFAAAGAPGYDAGELQVRIDNLRARVHLHPSVAAPPTSLAPRGTAPPARGERHGRDLALPVTLFAVGGAALVTSAVLGLTVRSTYNDLSDRCPGGACDPSLQASADGARTRAIVADVLLGVGAAGVITGVVTFLLPHGEQAPASRLPAASVACVPGGCAGSLRVTF